MSDVDKKNDYHEIDKETGRKSLGSFRRVVANVASGVLILGEIIAVIAALVYLFGTAYVTAAKIQIHLSQEMFEFLVKAVIILS